MLCFLLSVSVLGNQIAQDRLQQQFLSLTYSRVVSKQLFLVKLHETPCISPLLSKCNSPYLTNLTTECPNKSWRNPLGHQMIVTTLFYWGKNKHMTKPLSLGYAWTFLKYFPSWVYHHIYLGILVCPSPDTASTLHVFVKNLTRLLFTTKGNCRSLLAKLVAWL